MPDPNCKRCGGTGMDRVDPYECECTRSKIAPPPAVPGCASCGGEGFEDDGHGGRIVCSCTWATKAPAPIATTCSRCNGTRTEDSPYYGKIPCKCLGATPCSEPRLEAVERRQRTLAWAIAMLAQRNSGGALFTDEDPVFMAIVDAFGLDELNEAGRSAERSNALLRARKG